MASLIFLIIDIEIPVKLPYISSYFITSDAKDLQILILGTMILFKIIITIIMAITMMIITTMMISTTIFQNITEKLEKMTYFVFTILGKLLPHKVLYATNG